MNTDKLIEPNSKFLFNVTQDDDNSRLDIFISKQFNAYSRSFFQKLIEKLGVQVNGNKIKKSSSIVKSNDSIEVTFPSLPEKNNLKSSANNLGIELIYEHQDFLIIHKPAGVLVHSANSRADDLTLVDWLLLKFEDIAKVGSSERPGIVHRIDMLTSGLMIVPRNNYAHMTFSDMFKNRLIKKTYLAIVEGHPKETRIIDYSIVRHPNGNKMMHIDNKLKKIRQLSNAREAITHYKVLQYFDNYSLVNVNPITGRTHQIRVHFAAIGHPLLGDIVYGKKSKLIDRQALHAYSIEFDYEGEKFNFIKNPPKDFDIFINSKLS